MYRTPAAAILSLALLVAMPLHAEQAETESGQSLRQESADALEALQEYTAEQKNEAMARAETLIDRLDTRLSDLRERLEAQWEELDAATRDERQAAIDQLAESRDQLTQTYERLESNSGQAWEEIKSGFVRSYRALMGESETQ